AQQHSGGQQRRKHARRKTLRRRRPSRSDPQKLLDRLFTQPERIDACAAFISHPRDLVLQGKFVGEGNLWTQFAGDGALYGPHTRRIDCERTISLALWQQVRRNQVVRLIIHSTMKERWRKRRAIARDGSFQVAFDPRQPRSVVHLWNHPFTVIRLSTKAFEGHSIGVISWASALGKNTI